MPYFKSPHLLPKTKIYTLGTLSGTREHFNHYKIEYHDHQKTINPVIPAVENLQDFRPGDHM
ncbi:hypothetical protein [Prolixibacter denitrificans]|uniref:Uncharacterized protein n=1 Tax=Prolixibacter denitrificans TaxID=1541063 RepID=A0A2P8C5F3_9BACT|nr:hypothetical protein [Prolixibacter denitrificans]PSK80191.1 hypothetical protein CLV93_1216 [Prolixibacter denitrificans]GET22380.1 hypothetical protein JCM18694_26260 [Prolixibacter denitrificans]